MIAVKQCWDFWSKIGQNRSVFKVPNTGYLKYEVDELVSQVSEILKEFENLIFFKTFISSHRIPVPVRAINIGAHIWASVVIVTTAVVKVHSHWRERQMGEGISLVEQINARVGGVGMDCHPNPGELTLERDKGKEGTAGSVRRQQGKTQRHVVGRNTHPR